MVICHAVVRSLAEELHKRLRLKGTTRKQVFAALHEAFATRARHLARYRALRMERCGDGCNCQEINTDGD